MATSILTLGRKSTTYSAPRYNSVCPFCRPKPLTSVTVMPCTPMPDKASRTSSSLNGLMIAVTSFMTAPYSESEKKGAGAPRPFCVDSGLERLLNAEDDLAVADVPAVHVFVDDAVDGVV